MDQETNNRNFILHNRLFFGLLLAIITLFAIIAGGLIFQALIIITFIIGAIEIGQMLTLNQLNESRKYLILGACYLALPALALIYLRASFNGLDKILFLFFIIILTDVTAFFGGRYFKGKKLAPQISPK